MATRALPTLRLELLPAVLLTFLVGCGGTSDEFTGPRGTVSGSVTFDGKPVPAGSTVMFQSKEGNTYISTGVVKEDGKYELVYDGNKKLPAVTYLVQISPPKGGEPAPAKLTVADPKDFKTITPDIKKTAEDAKNAKYPFPAKYHSINTSKLTFVVKDGSNTADFKLEK